MGEQNLLNAFEDCIRRMTAGQTVDECLQSYPQFAAALRPMLEAGQLVQRARPPAAEVREAQDRVRFRVTQRVVTGKPRRLTPRLMPMVASILIVFALAAGTTSLLAQSSLPGDPLYGLKRFTESVRLSLANGNAALADQFNQRRIDEAEALLALRRPADVTFQGTLEGANGSVWSVAGLTVQVDPATPGSNMVQLGDVIEVAASTTGEGKLIAWEIRPAGEMDTQLLPMPTATMSPTRVPSVVPTATPGNTPTITPPPTVMPSHTLPPMPSNTPAPTATEEVCVPDQPEGWIVYTVKPGDSLSGLAAASGIGLDELMRVNCLTDPNLIISGQRLYLPFAPSPVVTTPVPVVQPTEEQNNVDDHGGSSGSGDNSGPGGGDDDSGDNHSSDSSGPGGGDD